MTVDRVVVSDACPGRLVVVVVLTVVVVVVVVVGSSSSTNSSSIDTCPGGLGVLLRLERTAKY